MKQLINLVWNMSAGNFLLWVIAIVAGVLLGALIIWWIVSKLFWYRVKHRRF